MLYALGWQAVPKTRLRRGTNTGVALANCTRPTETDAGAGGFFNRVTFFGVDSAKT